MISVAKLDTWIAWIRRGSRSGSAFGLVLLMAGAAAAQSARVYRDGQSWVEESSGKLPASRTLRVNTPLGSVHVEGGGSGLRWTVHKRFFASSEEEAKRQFAGFRVNSSRNGESAVLEVLKAGADGYLVKPVGKQVLAERVAALLPVSGRCG